MSDLTKAVEALRFHIFGGPSGFTPKLLVRDEVLDLIRQHEAGESKESDLPCGAREVPQAEAHGSGAERPDVARPAAPAHTVIRNEAEGVSACPAVFGAAVTEFYSPLCYPGCKLDRAHVGDCSMEEPRLSDREQPDACPDCGALMMEACSGLAGLCEGPIRCSKEQADFREEAVELAAEEIHNMQNTDPLYTYDKLAPEYPDWVLARQQAKAAVDRLMKRFELRRRS